MQYLYTIAPWKTAPFIRILFPFMSGIALQWYCRFTILQIGISFFCLLSGFLFLYVTGNYKKYKLRSVQGVLLQLMICSAGTFITLQNDIQNHTTWFGNLYNDSVSLIVRIDEPPVQKEKTNKATGFVESVIRHDSIYAAKGKILLYFKKDSASPELKYGDKILIKKQLLPIHNTGNPGAFNFQRYAAFQQIFYTAYMGKNDFILLQEKDLNLFNSFIYTARKYIITILRQNLSKDKNTFGIAEALLIGYKEDLDKDLVQAYSNTGVVHIIAISGLHLGLIYFMLSWILNRVPVIRKNSFFKITLILGNLWLFAILTGSSASVLRSAVMFSCILIGNTYFKRSSIYNSLASSAFILLCYDPYFLWDVGFQLSYLAIIGIVWLQQPIFHLIYIKNQWGIKIWNMLSVTLAAQLTAFPLCIYYFHQFPCYFLITNFVAVPLSTVILFAEIFLLCFSWIKIIATYSGILISFLTEFMNTIIKSCNDLPYSKIDNIYANVLSTWLMYGFVLFLCSWLLYRKKFLLRIALTCMIIFAMTISYSKADHFFQKKLIVYNITKMQAIELISGNKYFFIGDSSLNNNSTARNLHVKPAHIELQVNEPLSAEGIINAGGAIFFEGIRLLIIQKTISYEPVNKPMPVDILIISGNPSLKISGIVCAVKPRIIVFDSSNSLWKIAEWEKECSALLLRSYSVPGQGAFIFDINRASNIN